MLQLFCAISKIIWVPTERSTIHIYVLYKYIRRLISFIILWFVLETYFFDITSALIFKRHSANVCKLWHRYMSLFIELLDSWLLDAMKTNVNRYLYCTMAFLTRRARKHVETNSHRKDLCYSLSFDLPKIFLSREKERTTRQWWTDWFLFQDFPINGVASFFFRFRTYSLWVFLILKDFKRFLNILFFKFCFFT